MKRLLFLLLAFVLPATAHAQSSPGWALGYVPPPSEWNSTFAGKDNVSTSAVISAAGTTQGTATLLSSRYSVVTTVAANTGVELAVEVSQPQVVFDRGANTLSVYPTSGAQIESLGTNVPYTIAAGSQALFVCVSSSQCYAQASSFQ